MYMQDDVEAEARPAGGLSAAWSQVAVFASAVDASLGRWLSDRYGLGLTEYRALAHLVRASDKELRVNDLAHRVGLNQSSATRLLGRLEGKGLARRDICTEDGRGVYAVVTEQGEDVIRSAGDAYEGRVRELLTGAVQHFPQLHADRVRRALADVGALIEP